MTLQHGIHDRIAFLRIVMIFGVIVLHTPAYVPMPEIGNGWFDMVKAFFQLAVFRASVPVLTVISGFLLFRSCIDQEPVRCLTKKTRTILIPFLCFNLPLAPVALGAEMVGGMQLSANLWPFDAMGWLNAAFGLTFSPINYPLNFLRDLIVLILLAPLFGWLLRKAAWGGLVFVSIVFMGNFDGHLLQRDLMAVLFYVGGMAAVRKWDLRLLDRYAGILFVAFLLACAAILHYRIEDTTYLRVAAPILLWPATAWAASTRFGTWLTGMSKYSFFLFLAHAPLLMLSWILYNRYGSAIPYPVYWVLAPLVVSAVLVALYQVASAIMPRVFASMIGAGGKARPSGAQAQPRGAGIVPTAALKI
ncbi:acyltransferase [Massilia aurea]|uniref:acyltransferase family protein n=1 Tax=Massilia aurea TaxID=373040 RepID=UPI0034632E51